MLRLSVAKCGHRLMENDSIRKEINRLASPLVWKDKLIYKNYHVRTVTIKQKE